MTAKAVKGTYVYCVIADSRAPTRGHLPKGLPGSGPPRLLELAAGGRTRSPAARRWLVVADVPLARYGEAAIKDGLSDLDWVSRAAVAHEAVVESFIASAGLLPMKLFTIFKNDERAVEYIREQGRRIDAAFARVLKHEEWGLRLMLGARQATDARRGSVRRVSGERSGATYLARKKAQRDAAVELVGHAREVAAELYDLLARRSKLATRRSLAAAAGTMLLDAVFLVPRSRAASFRAAALRRARALEREGYLISLTGPWPPYSFVQD